jgi:hypothetical protein
VDPAACGDAAPLGTSMGTSMDMSPLTQDGFGEGWAGTAEGSKKQSAKYIAIGVTLDRIHFDDLTCVTGREFTIRSSEDLAANSTLDVTSAFHPPGSPVLIKKSK